MTALRMKSLFLTVFVGLSLLIPVCVLGDSTPIDWGTQANHLKLGPGKSMLLTCPAKGQIVPRLWGTDIYTDDSSICTAAVHAGLMDTASGGTVLVEGRAGQSSYLGSQRNGLNSRNYGAWSGSFTVAKAPGGTGIVPPLPPPPSGQASLSVSPVQIAPGGKVTVQWSAPGRTGQTNWVGLYRAGTPADNQNLNRPIWAYVRQESGSHEFPLPIQAQPGQYVFRLFYGDGYDLRATSNTFNVGSGTPPPPPNETAADVFLGDWLGAYHCAEPAGQMATINIILWREGNRILWTDWSVPVISPAQFSDESGRYKLVTPGRDSAGRPFSMTWYIDKRQTNPPVMEGEAQFPAYPACRRFRYVGMTHWTGRPAGPPPFAPRVE